MECKFNGSLILFRDFPSLLEIGDLQVNKTRNPVFAHAKVIDCCMVCFAGWTITISHQIIHTWFNPRGILPQYINSPVRQGASYVKSGSVLRDQLTGSCL